ncbi:penicillin-binding transpeptidase domain-containing protein [Oxalobacteraceae bacterium R-40]|uniref:Penicillin-binding protein 1A n=1 Tax=Keguizhuia sedimenti TaxID=3064264 RepID=A0ABU1BSZ3_9BURK|nr:penicillin-binding transpeptidase domain-containing protein [Oxalobacteraceae bacterium R-40]
MLRTSPHPSPARKVCKFAFGLLLGLTIGGAIGGVYTVRQLWLNLPAVDHLATYEPVLPLRIYDREGNMLAEYGEERRDFVPLQRIPLPVRQALLAIEDARYYEHGPVDYVGLMRSVVSNIRAGGHAQGGSTITMQVARMFFLHRQKTYHRKIMEILLAYKLESTYSKDKILELYMNQVYLGERAVVRQQYILKRMHELKFVDEPTYQKARVEELVLRLQYKSIVWAAAYAVEQARQMVLEQYGEEAYTRGLDVFTTISMREQLAATNAVRAGLLKAQMQRPYSGPEGRVKPVSDRHKLAELRMALKHYPDSGDLYAAVVLEVSGSKGILAALRDGTLVRIPLKNLGRSTMAALQPEAAVRRRIEAGSVIRVLHDGRDWRVRELPQMEGALVSMDVETGEILALAGGFDFSLNKFNHAVQAVRQPGSTFKPFIYSAALEKGYFPGTLIDDTQRLVAPAAEGRRAWMPRNYGHNYEGFISARRALTRSKNVVAVNLMEAAGTEYVQQFATRFGFIAELNPPKLPLALGAGAITPLQLTQAYAVFANGGYLVQPRLISSVRERGAKILYQAEQRSPREQVISPRNAYVMDSTLRDVVQHGTARRATSLGRKDLAGKTGTSNAARDVWFAGYSSGISSTVWIGHGQPRSLGSSTGGSLALPVWMEYMKIALTERQETMRELPSDLSMLNDDYIYSEYLAGRCVDDENAFIQSPVACAAATTTGRNAAISAAGSKHNNTTQPKMQADS